MTVFCMKWLRLLPHRKLQVKVQYCCDRCTWSDASFIRMLPSSLHHSQCLSNLSAMMVLSITDMTVLAGINICIKLTYVLKNPNYYMHSLWSGNTSIVYAVISAWMQWIAPNESQRKILKFVSTVNEFACHACISWCYFCPWIDCIHSNRWISSSATNINNYHRNHLIHV